MSAEPDADLSLPGGFYLSAIHPRDEEAYLEYFSDRALVDCLLAVPFPYTAADAQSWLTRCARERPSPALRFALREESGRLIGSIGLHEEPPADAPEAEFGYWLARPFWGRGLMPAAIQVFAQHAFAHFALPRLIATVRTANLASQRALEKAGFHREPGALQQLPWKDGTLQDAVIFSRLATTQ